ncbi:MAG: hypothetical protein J0G28_10720 [Afipia sp.]|nr:hypothetical protein [Afipia sp.]OJW64342.1 MAG: hypothetical protein BGO65_15415 [Afipia sp. 64-13]
MAEEAFALSPISARSTSPTDADYEAIREAFMETSRGRWFLNEYAKRNRNADTAMVLDAVARIEQSLAATRAATAEPEPQGPSAEELFAQVETILREARTSIVAILGEPVEIEGLTPFRRSARIIQEIAWGLRESGADVRICDLLDGQVRGINAASDALSDSGRDAVLQQIDVAILRVRQLLDDESIAETEAEQPDIAATDDLRVPEDQLDAEPPVVAAELPAAAVEAASIAAIDAETPDAQIVAAAETATIDDAMALDAGAIEIDVAEPDIPVEIDAEIVPTMAFADALPDTLPAAESIAPVADTAPAGMLQGLPPEQDALTVEQAEAMLVAVNVEASLGEHLIAQGIVAQAKVAPDLLAPIRRMSQAEKIAFFS